MMHWFEGPLAAFCTETTGMDVEQDRIVAAALVAQDTADGRVRVTRWLVSPGVPVPEEASRLHGLTEDHLQRNGRWPAPVMDEIARALVEHCTTGRPLVVMDAPFALTLLDRELRRHRASSLAGYLDGAPLRVLDPWVLDGHLDRHREGRRTLTDLCERYEVAFEGAHEAANGASASLELVRAVGRRFSARLERLSPAELHTLQAAWHAARTPGPEAPSAGKGAARAVGSAWPLRPALSAAA
ncbi:exonuclease domain-containing protein [Streptomyces pratensis]|uniref:exonuclease domain-containing protein n=1 Tax=Streptomyces pratensis TaxID=1169025 RepID=UPI003018A261